MTTIENGSIRRLPETQTNRIFESCYQSHSYVLITTTICSQDIFDGMVSLLDSDELDWMIPLNTSTSRQILFGQLNKINKSLPNIIFKKSRFRHSESNVSPFQPRSVANEIRSNLLLDTVVQRLTQPGELGPPSGFNSLSVRVEKPLGILVDKQNKSKYSIFAFEGGFDLGEVLQYTDPPMQGAVNYNPRDWETFCGIKDVLDTITQAAMQEKLILQDYDIHQVLYRVGENIRSLELILIDSERFRIDG